MNYRDYETPSFFRQLFEGKRAFAYRVRKAVDEEGSPTSEKLPPKRRRRRRAVDDGDKPKLMQEHNG